MPVITATWGEGGTGSEAQVLECEALSSIPRTAKINK
jgi:hypothetical protein